MQLSDIENNYFDFGLFLIDFSEFKNILIDKTEKNIKSYINLIFDKINNLSTTINKSFEELAKNININPKNMDELFQML